MDPIIAIGKMALPLIQSVLTNKQVNIQIPVEDASKLHSFSKMHSMENIVYYGLLQTNNEEVAKMEVWKKTHQAALIREAIQSAELASILTMLESKQIKHMVLKGPILKGYYPTCEMRSMADLDILVDASKLKQIKKEMIALGYDPKHLGGNHDVYYKLPIMNVEMHRAMMDEAYLMETYYRNIWDKVEVMKESSYQYEMKKEDFYIYFIAHAAKHYGQGGTGIRTVMDLWVYLQQEQENLDWDAIRQELTLIELVDFEGALKKLASYWFGEEKETEMLVEMEQYILTSGTYGTIHHANIVRGFLDMDSNALSSQKTRYLIKRFFPPYKMMREQFPLLGKIPILLPFFWGFRLVKAILKGRTKIATEELKLIKTLEIEEINRIKRIHEATLKEGIKRKY